MTKYVEVTRKNGMIIIDGYTTYKRMGEALFDIACEVGKFDDSEADRLTSCDREELFVKSECFTDYNFEMEKVCCASKIVDIDGGDFEIETSEAEWYFMIRFADEKNKCLKQDTDIPVTVSVADIGEREAYHKELDMDKKIGNLYKILKNADFINGFPVRECYSTFCYVERSEDELFYVVDVEYGLDHPQKYLRAMYKKYLGSQIKDGKLYVKVA